MASNSNCREVCVEVYVNGELYCIDSVEVPDEENVLVEFMVTDRIYELLGCSPGDITAQLEVDTDKCISVSRAALEGEDVQIDVDVKSLAGTTPENSPTESTTEWVKRKISGFFQGNFWMDTAVPEPEANLVTVRWPAEEPGNKKNSPKRVMKKMRAFFKKYFPLDQAGPSSDPETAEMNGPRESTEEKKISAFFKIYFSWDPYEPSCVPDASVPEPEPVSAEGLEVDISDGMDDQGGTDASPEKVKIKKMRAFFKKYFPLDQAGPSSDPETEPMSADGQEVDISDGMDASPETAEMNGPRVMKKMRAFFKKYFPLDQAGPSSDPETAEMNGPRESAKKKKLKAFFKKYFPLDQAGPSSDPETEPMSADGQEVDISNGMEASSETAEMNGPRESTTEWAMRKMTGLFQIIFWMNPAVPEPTPEKDRGPEPQANLVGPGSSSEIEKNSPKRESTEEKKMRAFFKKYFPLDQAGPSCDPETEHVSADGQEVDISNGMEASPETAEMNGPRESTTAWAMRKIGGFIQTLLWMDPAVPEQTPEKDRVPEPEANLVGVSCPGSSREIEKNSPKRESTEEKKMRAFFKKYFPLDQAGPSCDPESE